MKIEPSKLPGNVVMKVGDENLDRFSKAATAVPSVLVVRKCEHELSRKSRLFHF